MGRAGALAGDAADGVDVKPAYYNEFDPFAAQWLRNLISAGHIAPGDVDERSIVDVRADDLVGYGQCHFFAGIGGWSLALRQAGVPDDVPVWTGSCPCQPFSSAGKKEGFKDERHLWPEFFRLIAERRPGIVMGEQVSNGSALAWLDAVCDDLESQGYACRAADTCAAGAGAPHIRQRLYWLGHTDGEQRYEWREVRKRGIEAANDGGPGQLANAICAGLEGLPRNERHRGESGREREEAAGSIAARGADGGVGDMPSERCGKERGVGARPEKWSTDAGADGGPGPLDGFWRDADWLCCRDGFWRPVESGASPLVDWPPGSVGRMRADWRTPAHETEGRAGHRAGRLKGYGNAIVVPLAAQFVREFFTRKSDD